MLRCSRQCCRSPICCRATSTIHGTRNRAENTARPSATMPVPKVGTDSRMKMYCSDQRVASSSHRPASHARTARLVVDLLHPVGGIARPGSGADRRRGGDALQVVAGKLDVERRQVLVDALLALRAGNGNDLLALREEPGEHQLRGRALLPGRDLLEALD